MAHFDIFNGDADGIFSLIQLRKSQPRTSVKITGVKRDIQLVKNCHATEGDVVTVLDISMEKNQEALRHLLAQGAQVFYADHHRSGEIPDSEALEAHINLSADTCTSLIIDDYLHGEYRLWALAGAYGDNMFARADLLARESRLSPEEVFYLKELGALFNYNGYGESIKDLYYNPAELFYSLMEYSTPFELLDDDNSPYFVLRDGYKEDLEQSLICMPYFSNQLLKVFVLPNTPCSRRISGALGNHRANESPDKCHLILVENRDETYTLSMRAPLNQKQGADLICSQYPTGGGRAGAAGINKFLIEELDEFIKKVMFYYFG